MSLIEPQTVTINSEEITLPRVSVGDRKATYENVAEGTRLSVMHQFPGARVRRTVRVDSTKTAADPLLDGVSRQYGMSAYIVIDHPKVGFSTTETEQIAQSLATWLAAPDNLSKVVNGES